MGIRVHLVHHISIQRWGRNLLSWLVSFIQMSMKMAYVAWLPTQVADLHINAIIIIQNNSNQQLFLYDYAWMDGYPLICDGLYLINWWYVGVHWQSSGWMCWDWSIFYFEGGWGGGLWVNFVVSDVIGGWGWQWSNGWLGGESGLCLWSY